MKLFDLRAAACALGAMQRPPGDRISIWYGDAAPEIFQGLKVENRKPSWVVYIPPRLFASDIAHSLRHRENNGVAVYRMDFGGVVYLGEGRCIDTGMPAVKAVPCQAVSANFLNFSREWMLNVLLACRRITRELSQCVRRQQLAPRFLRAVYRLRQARLRQLLQLIETLTAGTNKIAAVAFRTYQRDGSAANRT